MKSENVCKAFNIVLNIIGIVNDSSVNLSHDVVGNVNWKMLNSIFWSVMTQKIQNNSWYRKKSLDKLYSFILFDIAEEKWGKGSRAILAFLCGAQGFLDFVSDACIPEYVRAEQEAVPWSFEPTLSWDTEDCSSKV